MSHCIACDVLLSDYEATRKIVRDDGSISYLDFCNTCYKESGIGNIVNVITRDDLYHNEDIEEEDFNE